MSHRFPIRHLGDLQIIQDQLGGEASTHQHQWPEWSGKGRKQNRPTRTVGILLDDFGWFWMCISTLGFFFGIIVQSYLHHGGRFIQLLDPNYPHSPLGSPHTPLPGRVPAPTKYSLSTWHQTLGDRLTSDTRLVWTVWIGIVWFWMQSAWFGKSPRRCCGGAFQVKYLECFSFAVWKLLP